MRELGNRRTLGALAAVWTALAVLLPGTGAASSGQHRSLARLGYDPAAAAAWFNDQRHTPGVSSAAAYARAQQRAVQRSISERRTAIRSAVPAVAPTPTWQPIGPAPLVQTGPTQNVSGRVITIATVGSGTSEKIFTGPAAGGVWSATLDGTSTNWSTSTDQQPSLTEGAIATSANGSTIYDGTGEDDQGGDAFTGDGVLVSTNGGTSWTDANPGGAFTGQSISSIAVDPNNSQHIYIAGSAGFSTSTDGGGSLTPPTTITYKGGTTPTDVSDMVVDPKNFNTVFIAVPGVGIEESTDGGANFTTLSGGLPAGTNFGRAVLAISSDGQTLYTEIQGLDSSGNATGALVYASTDGGTNWTNTNAPDLTNPGFYYGGGLSAASSDQGYYDLAIAVDPNNASVVYAAGIGMSVSTNGGASWSGSGTSCSGTNGNGCSLGGSALHPDFHALTFDSSGNLFIGNDGGVYELPAADAKTGDSGDANGANFVDLNTNQQTLQFYPGFSQIGDAQMIFAGAQDNGSPAYAGSGVSWQEANDGAGDGGFGVIDPLNTNIQWATAQGSSNGGPVAGTTDGWNSIDNLITQPTTKSADYNFVAPLILAQPSATLAGNVLYFGGNYVYKSSDGGQTWTATSSYAPTAPSSSTNDVSALAAAPSNPSVVYAGWGDGKMQISQDAGATWTTITPTNYETANTDTWITHIAVDPTNPLHAIVTFSGYTFPQGSVSQPHVIETTDGGNTWIDDTGAGLPGSPTNSAVFDGTRVIVATDTGVYSGTPSGAATAWSVLGAGLPLAQVDDLSLSSDGSTLVALTHGRGAWRLTLTTPTVTTGSASSVTQTGAALAGTVDPNGPAVTSCRFEYGTSASYGSSVACASAPSSGTSAVPVSGSLSGLQPGTEYHFRLVATTAGGTVVGSDATFTTLSPPSTTPAPTPTPPSTTPAPSPTPPSTTPTPGPTPPSTATTTSVVVQAARVDGTRVLVKVQCSTAATGCALKLRLTIRERFRKRIHGHLRIVTRLVTIGQATLHPGAGSRSVSLGLNGAGKRLLRRVRSLRATLVVSWASGSASRGVRFRVVSRGRHGRRRHARRR